MPRQTSAEGSEEPLARIALRRVIRSVRRDAETPEFGRLLTLQGAGAAGDALLALALAGTLYFSVPATVARGRVVLYLLITMAPFAVVGPVLANFLDRHRGGLRFTMVVSLVGRAACVWLLSTRLETLWLFPLAFGVLVLSRAAGVVRGAAMPHLVPDGRTLVAANASLSRVSAIAGMIAVAPGVALLKWPGVKTELLLTAVAYAAGAVAAFGLPRMSGTRSEGEQKGARLSVRSIALRQAVVAAGGMRLCVGFLIFHLAFALRREEFGSVGLGLLIGSAALGSLFGALLAPRLRRRLREEGILLTTLFLAGLTALVAGRFFSLESSIVLVFVFGVTSGASKVAFDSLVQRETPEAARGYAFARFESLLQVLWVAGALVPVALTISAEIGVVIIGVVAIALALVYLAGRSRIGSGALP